MLNLLEKKIEEAKSVFDQSSGALDHRRKAGLISGLMVHVRAAKDLIKWYQRRGLPTKKAYEEWANALDQLHHHTSVNQMLRARRKEAADEVFKLNKILALVQAGAAND